ncbi:YidB family protein [Paraburkholderia caribensis]|uniref:YidB family protein n=1 Tax=Paraburkholderia caribensis TaxID=75105 RepID=UPI00386C0378
MPRSARRSVPRRRTRPPRRTGFSREIVMSLLDSLGSMLGGGNSPQGGGQAALIAAALEFVNNQPGGLNGLIQRFQQNGAGDIIGSWVGTGENQPIAADTLHNVLGSEAVTNMAAKVGVEPSMVTGLLSQVLPHVINAATPNGEVPADGKLDAGGVSGALGALGQLAGLFGNKNA